MCAVEADAVEHFAAQVAPRYQQATDASRDFATRAADGARIIVADRE